MSDIAYIKLMNKASGLWASFEPTRPVALGDYGYLDRGSLDFRKEGNIFEEGLGESCGANIIKAAKGKTEETFANNRTHVHSTDNDVQVGIQGAASASATLRVSFESGGAALLLIHNVCTMHIDKPRRLKKLRELDIEFAGKILVTSVKECDAFFMAASEHATRDFEVKAGADAPVAALVGVDAGGTAGYRYAVSGGPSCAKWSTEDGPFYPLFKLERVPLYRWQNNMKVVRRGKADEYQDQDEVEDQDQEEVSDSLIHDLASDDDED